MKNTGTLRIQAFAARQSSPVEGVTVTVSGNGFTATRLTDAEGNADDVTLTTPACALSLDENNTTQPPYAVCDLVASKTGYRTVRIQGVQVFPGQVTLAQPEMIPDTEEMRDTPNVPIVIPPHSLFTGDGGSGPTPSLACVPRVLDRVIIPKNITVHLGRPAASARNVTVSFRSYIANVASPEALLKLCSDLLAEREENVSLRIANAQLEGKAAFYDLFIDLEHSTNLRTTAKELDVPERRFVRFLLEKRFVYRTASGNVLPYAKPANEGLFCVKDYCNHGHTGSYTLITPQGKLYFAELRDSILMVI